MTKSLSSDARELLDALIHSGETEWWKVVPDRLHRNNALNMLINEGLVEVRSNSSDCRATERGKVSNRKARDAGLIRPARRSAAAPATPSGPVRNPNISRSRMFLGELLVQCNHCGKEITGREEFCPSTACGKRLQSRAEVLIERALGPHFDEVLDKHHPHAKFDFPGGFSDAELEDNPFDDNPFIF